MTLFEMLILRDLIRGEPASRGFRIIFWFFFAIVVLTGCVAIFAAVPQQPVEGARGTQSRSSDLPLPPPPMPPPPPLPAARR